MALTQAFVFSVVVSLLGRRAGALTTGGVVGAAVVGTGVLWGAGWGGGFVLAAFFVGSSAVSMGLEPSVSLLDTKGHQRNLVQVFANGGAALVGAVLAAGSPLALWIVTASLASAAADTWATAIGGRSQTLPRDVLRGSAVPVGTSGGVTFVGMVGAWAGAVVVAGVGALWGPGGWPLFAMATVIGWSGALLDSILGSGVQGRFWCEACRVGTERRVHRCGRPAPRIGGIRWINNDMVNAAATSVGALAGWAAWRWWG